MKGKLRFGILRRESKFSDLSPGLQSLFNPLAVEKLRKQEEQEIEDELLESLLEEAEEEIELTETEKADIREMIEAKIAEIVSERNKASE